MNYKGFNNFSEFVNYKVEGVTEFGVTSFISEHTLLTAIVVIILFIGWKYFTREKEEENIREQE